MVTLPDAKKSDAGVEPHSKPRRNLIEQCADPHDVAIGYLVGGREKGAQVTKLTRGDISHAGGNRNSLVTGVAKCGAPRMRVYRRRGLDVAQFWPQHNDIWPAVNTATKYVASNTMTSHEWQPSVFLNGDIAEKITKIKQQEGPDLHVYGSANLVQTLIKHDLVDAFWLKIFPITLGGGKRLFAEGTIPAAFKVTESTVTSKGVIIVNYERAGAVPTGSL